jgi:peptide alpha-N-acetyltransferase
VDFYQYSMRKYTLRSLFQMIEYLDNVHNNKYFVKCAGLFIDGLQRYFTHLQHLEATKSKQENEQGAKKKLTPAEKKRLAKQKQKEEEELEWKKVFTTEGHIYTPELR